MTSAPVWAQWYTLIRTNVLNSEFYSNHASAYWFTLVNWIDLSVCMHVDTFPWSSLKALLKGSWGVRCRDGEEWEHTRISSFSVLWMSVKQLKAFTPDLYISYWSLSQKYQAHSPKGDSINREGNTQETRQRKTEKEIRKRRAFIHFCEWVWRKFLAVFVALIDLWPTMSLYLHVFYSQLGTEFCQIQTPKAFDTLILLELVGFNCFNINTSLK